MTSVLELSFLFQRCGEKLMMEPAARVVYLWGENVPIEWRDVPFWYLSWSEKWSRRAMRDMARQLGLSKSRDQDGAVVRWMNNHRRVPLFPLFERNQRFFARLGAPWAGKVVQKLLEHAEDGTALLIAESVRLSKAGHGTPCPSLFSRPSGRPARRLTVSPALPANSRVTTDGTDSTDPDLRNSNASVESV